MLYIHVFSHQMNTAIERHKRLSIDVQAFLPFTTNRKVATLRLADENNRRFTFSIRGAHILQNEQRLKARRPVVTPL